ncbi:MAG: pyruvate carboxyltransferase [Rikenellaceae bacterium]
MNTHPTFVDTTLRDGEQASGVAFTLDEKLSLVKLMYKAGVREFEVGTPAMGCAAIEEIKAITDLKRSEALDCRMIAWCRAMPTEIELARQCGVDGIHLSFPVSNKLLGVMGKSREWVVRELRDIVRQSYNSFDYVSVGAQDASRADGEFLEEFAREAIASGAKRIRLADTVGLLNPFSTHEMVRSIRALDPNISIEFHAHNDLGMACANTLAAWIAGADALSTTVNGLGERAGNAAMEEVAMAIEKSAGAATTLDKRIFPELCSYVERISGRVNSASKPIVGDLVLTHESGIHTKYLKRDRSTYQLFEAEEIGLKERRFRIGKHTCMATLKNALEELGVVCRDEILPCLLDEVRRWCTLNKRDLEPAELLTIYNTI